MWSEGTIWNEAIMRSFMLLRWCLNVKANDSAGKWLCGFVISISLSDISNTKWCGKQKCCNCNKCGTHCLFMHASIQNEVTMRNEATMRNDQWCGMKWRNKMKKHCDILNFIIIVKMSNEGTKQNEIIIRFFHCFMPCKCKIKLQKPMVNIFCANVIGK